MADLKDEISKIVLDCLPSDSLFLVDIKVVQHSRANKIVVLIDGDKGVDINTCGNVSRALSAEIDKKGLINFQYTLEVSSPGLTSPIKIRRQYNKNIGKKIKVKLRNKEVKKGKLLKIDTKSILLNEEIETNKKTDTREVEILFEEIKEAKALIVF